MMKRLILAVVAVAAMLAVARAADEITVSASVSVEKGYLVTAQAVQGQKIDMTGSSFADTVTAIGTNAGTIVFSGTPGVSFWRNTSTNIPVSLGVSYGLGLIELYPGETWQGRLATNTITAWASTNWYGSTNLTGTATANVRSLIIAQ